MEDGRWKMEAKDRRGEKREESKKCPVLAGDQASHSVTPNELWAHPIVTLSFPPTV